MATITITDTYDFNGGKDSGDGIGSILNNFGHLLEEKGWGHKYETIIQYTKIFDPYLL